MPINESIKESTRNIIERVKCDTLGPVEPGKPTTPNSITALRNCIFILHQLSVYLFNAKKVFEVGSGTGHQACILGTEFPDTVWQTSEVSPELCDIAMATLNNFAPPENNVLPPLLFNAGKDEPPHDCDAFFMSNVLHCMSSSVVEALIEAIGKALPTNGNCFIYGPILIVPNRYDTELNDGSGNEKLDKHLKTEHPDFGIKNIIEVDEYAKKSGMALVEFFYHEERNNYLMVYQKQSPVVQN